MPTYIYNYDSANEADKAKSFQPRYLGANVIHDNSIFIDIERGDPAIILLGNNKYILPDRSSEDDGLSDINGKLNDDYLAMVLSRIQPQLNLNHILHAYTFKKGEKEYISTSCSRENRFVYYELDKGVLKIHFFSLKTVPLRFQSDPEEIEKEKDMYCYQYSEIDINHAVDIDEFCLNPLVRDYILPKTRTNEQYCTSKISSFKDNIIDQINKNSAKHGTIKCKQNVREQFSIIWKKHYDLSVEFSMPKVTNEIVQLSIEEFELDIEKKASENQYAARYDGDGSSLVSIDPKWYAKTDEIPVDSNFIGNKISENSSLELKAVYSLKKYMKDDNQAPNKIDGITDDDLLNIANSCFDENKAGQIYVWLRSYVAIDQANTFMEGRGKENILKYLLDQYIKDKPDPLSLNEMKMCIDFFEAFYTADNRLDVLMGLVNDAVQGDALKIEKAYNLLVVVDKTKADEFIHKKIQPDLFPVADLWHLVDSWVGYNDDHKCSYREAVKKKIATAINDNPEFNIKLESFGGFVKYLGYDGTMNLENKVAMIYRKHIITFMLILGFLLILNSVLSFAKLAIVVLNLLVGVINLVLFAHIQLFQVLAMPFIASFPLGMALVLCLSFVAYDVSTSFSKDSANEDQLCLWLYSLGVKGSDRMVSMLEDSLFYKTLMPYFATYFTGANSKIAVVGVPGSVKSGKIGENNSHALDGQYAVLNKARCIRMQHANADGGRGLSTKH